MIRRTVETLVGALVGLALGYTVWRAGLAYFPVRPFPVGEWAFEPSLFGGAFAGALVVFFAYERNTSAWRLRVAVVCMVLAFAAVIAGVVGWIHTESHYGEIWAVGFGGIPKECVQEGYVTRPACLKFAVHPDTVLRFWGDSNVRAVCLLIAVSGIALAAVAATLGSLLLVIRALERVRVFELDIDNPNSPFEKIIRPRNPTIAFATFQAALASLRRRVCRIHFSGAAVGTGFLIGPDLVMTNHHVMARVIAQAVSSDVVRCVFDAIGSGATRDVELAVEWDVLHSPPSKVDLKADPKGSDPGPDELDFSVIRLAEPIGVEKIGGKNRGWIDLPVTFDAQRGDPLVIAQHPRGRSLEIGVDTDAILLVNKSNNRVRYRTNTEPGSSGSPCLDLSVEKLIAIHHSGDPSFRPAYNEGIPINKIRERLVAAGVLVAQR